MRRRDFLSGAVAAIAVGCTDPEAAPAPSTPTSSTQPSSSRSVPASATTQSPATTLAEANDPGIANDPFVLGVASGDPDSQSVVLWTALDPTAVFGDVGIACDVAEDRAFDQVVDSLVVTAAEADGYTARYIAERLEPGRTYWYRFRVGEYTSAVGRTRTLPNGPADRFGVALSSCQDRAQAQRWDNHLTLAADPDVDLVVWLGDFIYERNASSLDEYRNLYTDARRDHRLQASSAAHPWMSTWDDHEVVNDYDASVDPERRAGAYRAWWEFTPTRLPRPSRDGLQVYRFVDVGDLVRIVMLDCRQYQTDSTVLGLDQMAWFANTVDHDVAHTLVASPVVVSSLNVGALTPPYAFEAHPADQEAVIASLQSAPRPVVVSGDLHAQMELELAPGIPELMAPPLSSSFPPDWADVLPFLALVSPAVSRAEAAHGYLRVDFARDGMIHRFVNG
ncbi:MAG: alkaline phosphatase D family protein [Acidimicrobiales bacterium]